jgi:hypothetical protein
MSVSASTAPDFHPVVKDLPRVTVTAGATLELLVLASHGGHCAGVDLASGALVRAWSPSPPSHPLLAYDVVQVTLAELSSGLDAIPDPCQPEALVLAAPPEPVRHLHGRRVARLLRPLLHPTGQPLLGLPNSFVLFWERRPDHPSIALVEPEGPITLWREGSYLACRFPWAGHPRELPCLDRRLAAQMDGAGRTRMTAGKGDRLLVALNPPIDGRCHKVVEAILPPP